MNNHDYASQEGFFFQDFSDTRLLNNYNIQPFLPNWALSEEDLEYSSMGQRELNNGGQQEHKPYTTTNQTRQNVATTTAPMTTAGVGLALAHNLNDPASILNQGWQFQWDNAAMPRYSLDPIPNNSYEAMPYNAPLQTSPVDFLPTSTTQEMQLPMHVSSASMPATHYMSIPGPMETMGQLAYPLNNYTDIMTYPMAMGGRLNIQTTNLSGVQSSLPGSSPSSTALEVCSLSSSDASWTAVNITQARSTHGSPYGNGNAVFNPGETLHIRSESNSSSEGPHADQLSTGYEEMPFPMYSPQAESHSSYDFVNDHHEAHFLHDMTTTRRESFAHNDCAVHSPDEVPSPYPAVMPAPVTRPRPLSTSSSSSSSSPSATSPPSFKTRKALPAPLAKNTKSVIKKATASTVSKSAAVLADKKIGKRRGPLRPEQRQQAHEIRKLRACLRCKFLKKTCDKGDPCTGCRPSHARLWQVPCTRIDIRDLNYFLKDWTSDYERHVKVGVSVANIRGFATQERTIWITHGYGHFLPIAAREVYVANDNCFLMDWVEPDMNEHVYNTAKLAAGAAGVNTASLSDYVDKHLDDGCFEKFVVDYFEGTPFLTEILHTAYRFYQRTQIPVIHKALKLVVAYTLTVHITMAEGLSEEESIDCMIDDETSRWNGKTVAPVMIHFQIKVALAEMWRDLQKDVLDELSSLYSASYQGKRSEKWPTIFMVATILLAVWELIQFDCHYREPDTAKVDKFCADMESTPVGVVVGLFAAISQKLPSFMEWDTSKHGVALDNDGPICDALTEVREHVLQHGESTPPIFVLLL